MRSAVIFACSCVLLTIVNADNIAESLSESLKMPLEEATTCIRNAQASTNDFRLLDDAVNNMQQSIVTDSIGRRAACAMACIGQKKTWLTGPKLNLPSIQAFVETYGIPEEPKLRVFATTEVCAEQVADVTDECQVVYEFIGCVIKNVRQYS